MPSLLKSAAAGLLGGLVAAAAMDLFQRAAAPLMGGGGGDDDPATVEAANSATTAAGGEPVPDERKGAAGELVHYFTGAGFGLAYGVLAARVPAVTAGFGTAYGLGLAALVDNGVVPLAGWGPAPWRTDAATQAYGAASHLVYGAVLEGTRRVIAGAAD